MALTNRWPGCLKGLPLARSLTIAQGGTLRAGNDRATGGARFDFAFPKMVV